MKKAVSGGLFLLVASWISAVGCASSTSNETASQPDASLACPVTVVAAQGAACPSHGQDCPIGYACGPFNQQAHCICTGGKYACTDATGAAVDKTNGPQCVGQGQGNDAKCPSSESAAEGKACAASTAGLICHYTGLLCEGATEPFIDDCQCVGVADGGLEYRCEPKQCNPGSDGAVPDTNAPPPQDAGTDGG